MSVLEPYVDAGVRPAPTRLLGIVSATNLNASKDETWIDPSIMLSTALAHTRPS